MISDLSKNNFIFLFLFRFNLIMFVTAHIKVEKTEKISTPVNESKESMKVGSLHNYIKTKKGLDLPENPKKAPFEK